MPGSQDQGGQGGGGTTEPTGEHCNDLTLGTDVPPECSSEFIPHMAAGGVLPDGIYVRTRIESAACGDFEPGGSTIRLRLLNEGEYAIDEMPGEGLEASRRSGTVRLLNAVFRVNYTCPENAEVDSTFSVTTEEGKTILRLGSASIPGIQDFTLLP